MNNINLSTLEEKANRHRKTILQMIVNAHASHIASSYSCIDLLTYLYEYSINIDPKYPQDPDRDRFILSKGWAISALYTVLADKGFFDAGLLKQYCQDGSKMIGISTRNGIAGIESTTGSMGHGLPLGVGMAIAGKISKKKHMTYVLVSDGECDEGSTWESILQAGHHKLDNLVVIIDYNKWQSFGKISEILNLEPLFDKWKAFGWSVKEINGHNFDEMHEVFQKIPFAEGNPSVIIAHTIKGKGVSVFENRNEWHYKTPTVAEIEIAEKELL